MRGVTGWGAAEDAEHEGVFVTSGLAGGVLFLCWSWHVSWDATL